METTGGQRDMTTRCSHCPILGWIRNQEKLIKDILRDNWGALAWTVDSIVSVSDFLDVLMALWFFWRMFFFFF